jgi:hypothetical protein
VLGPPLPSNGVKKILSTVQGLSYCLRERPFEEQPKGRNVREQLRYLPAGFI